MESRLLLNRPFNEAKSETTRASSVDSKSTAAVPAAPRLLQQLDRNASLSRMPPMMMIERDRD
jgi:hypothetical protein